MVCLTLVWEPYYSVSFKDNNLKFSGFVNLAIKYYVSKFGWFGSKVKVTKVKLMFSGCDPLSQKVFICFASNLTFGISKYLRRCLFLGDLEILKVKVTAKVKFSKFLKKWPNYTFFQLESPNLTKLSKMHPRLIFHHDVSGQRSKVMAKGQISSMNWRYLTESQNL